MLARLLTASVVLLAAGLCTGDDKKGDKKDDKDLLQGEWVVVSMQSGGKKTEKLKGQKLLVKGDEWTPPGGGKFKLKFKIDATKSPKRLDLVMATGGKSTWAGIYKIEKDTLTFARSSRPGGARPGEFKGGPKVFLMVCKRAGK